MLKNFFLYLPGLLFFLVSSPSFSQHYTIRDQEEISYQAQLTLSMYKDLLNVISYEGLATQAEIKELIRNSYTPSRNQIFYSDRVIIEDNVKPSNLGARNKQDKTVKDYLHYFDLAYKKSEGPSIDFSNIEVSNLKYSNYLYIKVKYTSLFKGKHKEESAPYKAVDRLAEFRVEVRDNKWKTYISSIVFYDPRKPLNSGGGDVKLDKSGSDKGTFTQLSERVRKEGNNGTQTNSQTEKFSEQKQEQDSVFNYYLEVGKQALAAEDLQEAFAAFSEAEKINPYHQELRKNLMELTKAQNLQISSVDKRFEYAKRNAERALTARDYTKARNLYAEALRLKPEEEALKVEIEKLEGTIQQIALFESKYAVGEYKEAVKDYTKAIKKEKSNADYYYGRGKSYEKLNAFDKAFQDYSKAIELDGNFIEALSSRARLYVKTRQLPQAVADYTLILSNRDYANTYYPERAKVKQLMGDIKGAIEDYNEAIRLNPDVAEHHFQKGAILSEQKNYREAINSFSEAIEKDPRQGNYFYHRGMALAALESIDKAAADFEKARELGAEEAQLAEINKLALQFYAKGEGAVEEKKYNQALESFKDALLISPAFGRAWLRKGDTYFILENYDSAIFNYGKAIEQDPMSFGYFKRGLAYQQKGEQASALEDFKKFVPIGKELVGRAEEAKRGKRSYNSAPDFIEERADALYTLGYAQLINHQFVEALENLDMAIHARRFFPKAYFARGAALYALEDYKRAIKNMEESIKMGLSDPIVFYSLGNAYVADGKLRDAIQSFSHTVKLDPQYSAAYKERALCYKDTRQYAPALEDVKTAISLNEALKEDATLMTHKGMLELYLNKVQEAKQSFDQALQLDKDNGWAMYGKACALAQENKLDESLAMYRKAFQTRQIDWQAIKNDPLISPVSKQRAFKDLVKTYL